MFQKVRRVGIVALLAAFVAAGLTAAPAVAEEAPSEEVGAVETAAPAGVSQDGWSDALSEAQAQFGEGDKAYVEALKDVSLAAVVYCDMQGSWMPGDGHTYRFPARSGYGEACVMESGLSNNGAVMVLQRALNICYGRSLVVDGSFGPATHSALMYAQSRHGIAVDGVWGPVTRKTVKLASLSGTSCRAYPG